MKKKHVLALVLALFTAAGILGPRVNIDIALGEIILPDNLDLYLTESEARFDDITEGTEKTIMWAGKAGGKTPDQILMDRAKAVGIDPEGMPVDELEKKVKALETLTDEE